MWHHDVTNARTCQFSAVCLTFFPFEFRPRTFIIGFYGKNRAYNFGVQFSFNASKVIENFEAHPTSAIPARNPPCRRFSFRWCRPYVNVKLSGACSELKITYQLYGLLILNLIRKVRIAEPLYYLASLRILLSLNTVHIIVSFFFKRLPTCITIFDQNTAHVYLRDRFLF